jgi:hypothetical protein
MGSVRTNPGGHTPTAGDPDKATERHHRASKLFENDHAYAARLVQMPIAIPGGVRSATIINARDQIVAKLQEDQEDDRIAVGIDGWVRAHRDDP